MSEVLNELNDLFKEVEATEDVFENVPDGTYLAEIQGAEYKEAKSSGRPMVQIACKIIAGDYEGRWHSRFLMLTGNDETGTRRNLNQMARQLRELGLSTEGGLQATLNQLESLEGKEVEIQIETITSKKNGKDYTNTFLKEAE